MSMAAPLTFDHRLANLAKSVSPAVDRVARFFQANPEEVLLASASSLAKQTGTSDATVIRTAQALGFSGMEELRRTLANELREAPTPARRVVRTLDGLGNDLDSAFRLTMDIHQSSLDALRRDISSDVYRSVIDSIVEARRVFIFGIGPSSSMADYFKIQLRRFGVGAASLTQTGLLLADGLQQLEHGDLIVLFAYGRVYRELAVVLDEADRVGINRILVTDTLEQELSARVNHTLSVARGRADLLSMHTATIALIEALLVGVAMKIPQQAISNLERLDSLRSAITGKNMKLKR